MRRIWVASLMLVLTAEVAVSAVIPCCCFERWTAAVAETVHRDAPAHSCCHRDADLAPTAPEGPQRRSDCTCRLVEPFSVAETDTALLADASLVAVLPLPTEVESAFRAALLVGLLPRGAGPPGASDAGPPCSSTPALLPGLAI